MHLVEAVVESWSQWFSFFMKLYYSKPKVSDYQELLIYLHINCLELCVLEALGADLISLCILAKTLAV